MPTNCWGNWRRSSASFLTLTLLLLLCSQARASIGDRLPEFRECVQICERENCGPDAEQTTPIPLHRRLLLWDCPAECDYACQHIVTDRRVAAEPPQPVVQFHGKWPFHRLLGVQEPFSVICSAGNLWAHYRGLHRLVLPSIPPSYPLRPFYIALARIGMLSWVLSIIFHTRDFPLTEELDYFGAGASVMYGLYYTVVRVFGLSYIHHHHPHAHHDHNRSTYISSGRGTPPLRNNNLFFLQLWTTTCLAAYLAHVVYLGLVRWDYTYNMAANVVCGAAQHLLWSWFSWRRWRETRRIWALWPAVVVVWVATAMSLELFDFPPVWSSFDAHGMWHLGTIFPTMLWYHFLVRDSQYEMSSERLKA